MKSFSDIIVDNSAIRDRKMPEFYNYEWCNFAISVAPKDFRRFKYLRHLPVLSPYLSGSQITLNLRIRDLSEENRQISYKWWLNREVNSEIFSVDRSTDWINKVGPVDLALLDNRLHMDGKHTLTVQCFWDENLDSDEGEHSTELVMAEFTIFDRDTMMVKRGNGILLAILGGLIVLLVRLFVG